MVLFVYLPAFLFVCKHYIDHSLCWSVVQISDMFLLFPRVEIVKFWGSRSNLGHENPVFGHDFCSICCRNLKYVSCCRLWINGHCMTLTLVFDPWPVRCWRRYALRELYVYVLNLTLMLDNLNILRVYCVYLSFLYSKLGDPSLGKDSASYSLLLVFCFPFPE